MYTPLLWLSSWLLDLAFNYASSSNCCPSITAVLPDSMWRQSVSERQASIRSFASVKIWNFSENIITLLCQRRAGLQLGLKNMQRHGLQSHPMCHNPSSLGRWDSWECSSFHQRIWWRRMPFAVTELSCMVTCFATLIRALTHLPVFIVMIDYDIIVKTMIS